MPRIYPNWQFREFGVRWAMTLKEEKQKLLTEPCHCIRCHDCGGNGTVWVDTFDYPEEDLDICPMCDSGIVEVCFRCRELEDMDDDMDT